MIPGQDRREGEGQPYLSRRGSDAQAAAERYGLTLRSECEMFALALVEGNHAALTVARHPRRGRPRDQVGFLA
jgi:hypothetical protein